MNGLKDQYKKRMTFEYILNTKAMEKIKEYKLGQHGMVILSPEGEVLWKRPGHLDYTKKNVKEGIETALEKS